MASTAGARSLMELLLTLPRELRDLIYKPVFSLSNPISLHKPFPTSSCEEAPITLAFPSGTPIISSPPNLAPNSIISPLYSNPQIAAEAAESYYACNTFIISLLTLSSHLEFCTWGSGVRPGAFMRHLIVEAKEDATLFDLYPDANGVFHTVPISHRSFESGVSQYRRAMWSSLLSAPYLCHLTIRLQKSVDGNLEARDFTPVLHHLRLERPNIDIKIEISFDDYLKEKWEDPIWQGTDGVVDPYDPAGYTDCTKFFEPPNEVDKEYVKEFLPDEKMPKGRPVQAGLLDQSMPDRQVLQELYVVREPALFRIEIERHWNVYRTLQAI